MQKLQRVPCNNCTRNHVYNKRAIISSPPARIAALLHAITHMKPSLTNTFRFMYIEDNWIVNAMAHVNRREQTLPRVRKLAMPLEESRWIIRYVARCKPVSVFGSSYENITSSTKPEVHYVHNVLHCRQRETETRPKVGLTCRLQKISSSSSM